MHIESLRPEVAEKLGWYVYRLVGKETGRTLYVGKGHASRVHEHRGRQDITEPYVERVVWSDLPDEKAAYNYEAGLIAVLGLTALHNKVQGHGHIEIDRTVDELNDAYAAPEFSLADLPADEEILFVKVRKGKYKPYDDESETFENESYYELLQRGDDAVIDRICGDWRVSVPNARAIKKIAVLTPSGVVGRVYSVGSWADATHALDGSKYKKIRRRWSGLTRVHAAYEGHRLVDPNNPARNVTQGRVPTRYGSSLRKSVTGSARTCQRHTKTNQVV
jgi:hypothetical protein